MVLTLLLRERARRHQWPNFSTKASFLVPDQTQRGGLDKVNGRGIMSESYTLGFSLILQALPDCAGSLRAAVW